MHTVNGVWSTNNDRISRDLLMFMKYDHDYILELHFSCIDNFFERCDENLRVGEYASFDDAILLAIVDGHHHKRFD